MLLRLSSTPMLSTDIGRSIVTSTSSLAAQYAPRVYQLDQISIGSNSANLTATTSYIGVLHYAIVKAGTPNNQISQADINSQNLTAGVVYGSMPSSK